MEIIKFLQSFSNPFLDVFFQMITMLGEDIFFIFIMAIIYWCVDKETGYKMAFAIITSTIVNFSLKEIFAIPRPIGEPGIRSLRLHTATGYSFPSGHTQSTSTFWTFLMGHLRRGWLYILGTCMILLVAVSRMYLGVHTLLDVVGGAIIGFLWIFVSNYIYELSKKHNKKIILLLMLIPALIGLMMYKTNDYYKAAGTFSGLFMGYLIEPRYVRFKVEADFFRQIVKLIVGLSVAVTLRMMLKAVLPQVLLSDFFRYFILIIWVTIAAPLLFKRIIN